MIVAGRERGLEAQQPGLRGGPDDEDDEEPGEHLGDRTGERGEPLGADHLLAIAVGLRVEPGGLALLLAVGADEPDGADPLGHRRGDLAPLLAPGAGVAPEPADQPLEQHHEERHEGQGEEGEPHRDLAQHRPA